VVLLRLITTYKHSEACSYIPVRNLRGSWTRPLNDTCVVSQDLDEKSRRRPVRRWRRRQERDVVACFSVAHCRRGQERMSTRLQGSNYSCRLFSCRRCFCLKSVGKAARKHLCLSSIFMLRVRVEGRKSDYLWSHFMRQCCSAFGFCLWVLEESMASEALDASHATCVVHTCGKHWTRRASFVP
jgi:hypothetical protein